jgi:hypothetical protein
MFTFFHQSIGAEGGGIDGSGGSVDSATTIGL